MPNIGFAELLLLTVIILLVFGGNRLGSLGEGLGQAIRNFRRGLRNDDEIDVTPDSARLGDKKPDSLNADKLKDEQRTRT